MHDSHTIFQSAPGDTHKITAQLLNRGATIAGITLEGLGNRSPSDVVLSYPSSAGFDSDPFYLGTTVGPVANRLQNGRIALPSDVYTVPMNERARSNLLHGGKQGLHQQIFQASPTRADNTVVFSLALPHLSDGFPGDRLITVQYELIDSSSLQIDFVASTDRTTVMNLANHAYFNLGGALSQHELKLNSEAFTPVNDRLIPRGNIAPTAGTELDYSEWRSVDKAMIDHNFVLPEDGKLQHAASLRLRSARLQLDVFTTQSALQVYTGDGLAEPFGPRWGICLEAQGFPDAPNQPNFPSIVLEPGTTYRQRTIYRIGHIN